ncbi:MmcQ/YjbR family DNA-binding protein [Flavobacterium sp. F-380]|jgi:predicted DNA-binding protein (MmcQ/YjbR family)|uniref:MmcQ/YjbR family DNA-binding protein n=1 Tax=Flavobacterium kayseriense TaxID=2764714 RepID=A0ABR7J5P6_9FLAO|nr:MmcQ/YjbR family DNA-binding protein [Flavobacterium kayseriense]MBC5840856.1 MmcQ/YjbR family DNA-binding protein [Flavobacterium kayseriense]MBC5846475.1 MmcQ/YjbR family DNA-binding protein [Flavobacterium kayseriense]MBU0940962.1 MmcQ/YjbR family DNA-binding protein [Bacteroidota bacterium]
MNLENFYEYCLSKKGVTEHFPFDNDALVFKVGGKIFALTSLEKWELGSPGINLKCDPDRALELRAEYESINSGFHMNKKHWNTVLVNLEVSDALVSELIDHSYALVYNSLTKKIQEEISKL